MAIINPKMKSISSKVIKIESQPDYKDQVKFVPAWDLYYAANAAKKTPPDPEIRAIAVALFQLLPTHEEHGSATSRFLLSELAP